MSRFATVGERAGDQGVVRAPGRLERAPGLYLHVPFCARVCPYCDFAVQTGGPRKRASWARALEREIDAWSDAAAVPDGADRGRAAAAGVPDANATSPWRHQAPFDTVYLGGGTPSQLDVDVLGDLLERIRDRFGVRDAAEITLEANPEDVDAARLDRWRAVGVTRLSLGVQSFDDGALASLGRMHGAAQAATAVRASLEAGFDSVSLDLIFALPGQTTGDWRVTLEQAVELGPDHVSCYELTVHERTRFYRARERGELVELGDDDKAEQFFLTHELLADAGYVGYEVSNFARHPDHRSRHNAKYWDHTPYLGIGPSAHSFDGRARRWWNERRLVDWRRALDADGRPAYTEEVLSTQQLALEALALGLRTTAGVDLERFRRRWGIDLAPANRVLIERLIDQALLQPGVGERLVPTVRGLALADTLAASFEIPHDAGSGR